MATLSGELVTLLFYYRIKYLYIIIIIPWLPVYYYSGVFKALLCCSKLCIFKCFNLNLNKWLCCWVALPASDVEGLHCDFVIYPLSLYVCYRSVEIDELCQDFYKLLFIFWLIIVFLEILTIIESM